MTSLVITSLFCAALLQTWINWHTMQISQIYSNPKFIRFRKLIIILFMWYFAQTRYMAKLSGFCHCHIFIEEFVLTMLDKNWQGHAVLSINLSWMYCKVGTRGTMSKQVGLKFSSVLDIDSLIRPKKECTRCAVEVYSGDNSKAE